jgi:hypothetical protein
MSADGLHFDAYTHTYTYGGRVVPGVTSILAPLTNLSMVPPDVLAAASAFGTAVHKACELWDLDDLDADNLDPELQPYLAAWMRFSSDHRVRWDGIEKKVFHKTLRYAGTLDRRGMVDGTLTVVDIKSSIALYPAVGPQLAAYLHADVRSEITSSVKRLAVQLKGDGTYVIKEYADPLDFSVFTSLLTLQNWCDQHQITPNFQPAS